LDRSNQRGFHIRYSEFSSDNALAPADHDPAHTFSIQLTIDWRRLDLLFEPGKFAAPLLEVMSEADGDAKSIFKAVLSDCQNNGASVSLRINGQDFAFSNEDIWLHKWSRVVF
jgi:hypothetical protein